MKTRHLLLALTSTLLPWGFLTSHCQAANLSVNMTPGDPSQVDPAYPGSGSTITTTTDKQTGITVTIAGRNYGTSPAARAPRWGLQAEPLPWKPKLDGFVVTGGFRPAVAGATTTAAGGAASYVSIVFSNVLPNTLFQNVSVDFQGLEFTSATNAWGAASPGGFSNWSAASVSNSGKKLNLALGDFVWTGGAPLEIRLYGLTGVGEGAFSLVKVSANIQPLGIPEPKSLFLVGAGLMCALTRRKGRLEK